MRQREGASEERGSDTKMSGGCTNWHLVQGHEGRGGVQQTAATKKEGDQYWSVCDVATKSERTGTLCESTQGRRWSNGAFLTRPLSFFFFLFLHHSFSLLVLPSSPSYFSHHLGPRPSPPPLLIPFDALDPISCKHPPDCIISFRSLARSLYSLSLPQDSLPG